MKPSTFKPLSRGRFKCNQTQEVIKRSKTKKVAYAYNRAQNPIFARERKQKEDERLAMLSARKRGAPYGWA
ncbi:MAG TPA: hypothetical protein VMR49_02160 [Candidatus Paceibacterota bacterium]|jgi:hypothetical protein|nr:hypothetical protein [Candidatus Paceibacterota bacterium]